jgi:hypothetical protein
MLPAVFQELLIKTKPRLKDGTTKDETIKDLHKIASLAQTFTEQRLKSIKKSHLSDFLDQEGPYHCSASVRTNMKPKCLLLGVSLWNASGVVRLGSAPDSRVVVAACRLLCLP